MDKLPTLIDIDARMYKVLHRFAYKAGKLHNGICAAKRKSPNFIDKPLMLLINLDNTKDLFDIHLVGKNAVRQKITNHGQIWFS